MNFFIETATSEDRAVTKLNALGGLVMPFFSSTIPKGSTINIPYTSATDIENLYLDSLSQFTRSHGLWSLDLNFDNDGFVTQAVLGLIRLELWSVHAPLTSILIPQLNGFRPDKEMIQTTIAKSPNGFSPRSPRSPRSIAQSSCGPLEVFSLVFRFFLDKSEQDAIVRAGNGSSFLQNFFGDASLLTNDRVLFESGNTTDTKFALDRHAAKLLQDSLETFGLLTIVRDRIKRILTGLAEYNILITNYRDLKVKEIKLSEARNNNGGSTPGSSRPVTPNSSGAQAHQMRKELDTLRHEIELKSAWTEAMYTALVETIFAEVNKALFLGSDSSCEDALNEFLDEAMGGKKATKPDTVATGDTSSVLHLFSMPSPASFSVDGFGSDLKFVKPDKSKSSNSKKTKSKKKIKRSPPIPIIHGFDSFLADVVAFWDVRTNAPNYQVTDMWDLCAALHRSDSLQTWEEEARQIVGRDAVKFCRNPNYNPINSNQMMGGNFHVAGAPVSINGLSSKNDHPFLSESTLQVLERYPLLNGKESLQGYVNVMTPWGPSCYVVDNSWFSAPTCKRKVELVQQALQKIISVENRRIVYCVRTNSTSSSSAVSSSQVASGKKTTTTIATRGYDPIFVQKQMDFLQLSHPIDCFTWISEHFTLKYGAALKGKSLEQKCQAAITHDSNSQWHVSDIFLYGDEPFFGAVLEICDEHDAKLREKILSYGADVEMESESCSEEESVTITEQEDGVSEISAPASENITVKESAEHINVNDHLITNNNMDPLSNNSASDSVRSGSLVLMPSESQVRNENPQPQPSLPSYFQASSVSQNLNLNVDYNVGTSSTNASQNNKITPHDGHFSTSDDNDTFFSTGGSIWLVLFL